VTLFAFAEGEGLSEHTAPFDALIVVTDGQAEVTIAGERHAVRAGETIRLPAGVPHAVHAPADVRLLLVMLRDAR
jgi:quercetin dioxygenase-like cupin family protein